MCGIVGYIGEKDNINYILIDGLKRLEYRGYDSAGIAIIKAGKLILNKYKGKISQLEEALISQHSHSTSFNNKLSIGIGHTRWATHGKPADNNAHPHLDCNSQIAVVHNGIIENYKPLKENLIKKGHKFTSQTDTEVIPHLIEDFLKEGYDFFTSIKKTIECIEGAYALAIINKKEPDKIIAVRLHSPLIIGLGDNENFIASDIPALLNKTKKTIILEDNELAIVRKDKVEVFLIDSLKPKKKQVHTITWDAISAEKAGYKHFMLKEIHEQPQAVLDTLRGRIVNNTVNLEELNFDKVLKKGSTKD
jgi:glucosamine--fructose-6-phosphate aminotransferase (isomerizing)